MIDELFKSTHMLNENNFMERVRVVLKKCVFDLFYHILIYFHLNHHNARHSSGLNLCFPLLFNVSICGLRAEFHPSKVEIRVRVPADALFIK